MSDEHDRENPPRGGRPPREQRLRGIARRIFRDIERDGDDDPGGEHPHPDGPRADARELIGAVLETGDKAKTEIVRMLAREVRAYLEALELHKDLQHLITNHSLEIHASIHLKPLHPPPPEARREPPKATETPEE